MFKKIAKILRGGSTPAQMMASCVVGAMLGFMPGFVQAPGLVIALALILLVINVNITLALMIAGGAKLLSLAAIPFSFACGRYLLDGPTQGLFKEMINAPVLALFGFEYYVTTGGLLLGAVIGVMAGIALIKLVGSIRTNMSSLEQGSDRYKQWIGKWWVKLLLKIFVGKGSKEDYTAMLGKKGKLIRPIGVAVCGLVVVGLIVVQMFFSGPFVASALRRGLEQANGATVDLADADIDLAGGRMTLTGLALADPKDLSVDLFRAGKIEADISTTSLLRKQLRLDRVVFTDASHGETRSSPGKLVGYKPEPVKPVEAVTGEKTLEDYLQKPLKWQQKLTQIRQWLELLSGPGSAKDADDETEEAATGETLRQRLERQAQALGYANVIANHLIVGSPRFVIDQLVAENVETNFPPGETLTIHASYLSTQPSLLSEEPKLSVVSSGKTLSLSLGLAGASAGSGDNRIDFKYMGLDVDSVAENLSQSNKPISGGTMDLALQGTIRTSGGTYIDLPMQVTLHNTTVSIAGSGSAPIGELKIPLGLRGPIDNPRIRLDDSQLADALVAAGAGILAKEVRGRADDLIQGAVSDIDLGKKIPGADLSKILPGLVGQKKPSDKNDRDSKKSNASKKDEASKKNNDIGNRLKGLGQGLFGKKKKGG